MGIHSWMIYGAYGFSGRLIAREAFKRGHKPLLAGRSEKKLTVISRSLGLDGAVLNLEDLDQLIHALQEVDLVINAAGPFLYTAQPLVAACLESETNYLDISGEVLVIEQVLSMETQAQRNKITMIPGVGFNVLASDSLTRYVAERVESPNHLDIATQWTAEGVSAGSLRTMIEGFPTGALARRGGQLVPISLRNGQKRIRFLDGVNTVLPASLGDLATAYRTTGIPNITTYTAFPERTATLYIRMEPILRKLYASSAFRLLAGKWIGLVAAQKNGHGREGGRSQVWASARNSLGSESQAWLETADSYDFTAVAAVRSVERVLSRPPVGVWTPAEAFGADFVLEIPGTTRVDALEPVQARPGKDV